MEFVQELLSFVEPHWPGLTWSFVAMLIGQVMAHRVFTKAGARKRRKSQWFWWWMRKTLPLHPVVAGAVLGLVWQNPEHADPVWPLAGSMMYFAGFGGLSVWLYQVIKQAAKEHGIRLTLPGGDSIPPLADDLEPPKETS